ncbi:DUF294 nucleotidyltransferase-like domain-containing protein [Sporosarcina sp. GW1-11]|uniref:DUF294 nucleotidyltransferase-like domain-containing protein n=1 Tax=Sporosarcina sp. GW1-11 TaxID=2899126 RepID=UPI00294CF74E|nr:DUF294 nucleotidyltransferase-like domain-containing protein [Sporosarcina sp. GW1-11]MDV6377488.1 DUF294 nucleotidyltransferase-like domain-containing protein [Sporosarcina sp. GW1-11]
MPQTIKERELYERIHKNPLFVNTTEEEFNTLLTSCKLKFYDKAEKSNYFKKPEEGLVLVLQGSAEVLIEGQDGSSVMLEVIQENEFIGFSNFAYYLGEMSRPLDKHHIDMEVAENSICLQIPYEVIKKRMEYQSVRDFVLRKMSSRLSNVYTSLGEQVRLADEYGESEPYVRRVQDFMNSPVITIHAEAKTKEIAELMIDSSVSSIVVTDQSGKLVGIVTEKDLVERVIAGGGSPTTLLAKDIMTKNPHTAKVTDYYYEALTKFYKHGIKHLPVVKAGKPVGIVTFATLMTKRDRNSMSILKTIEEASFEKLPVVKAAIYDVLSNLIQDEISTIHTLEIITKFYDRLAKHCVMLAVQSMEEKGLVAPVPFAWYQMGSGARGEQFMLTDQDHFLVYEDVPVAQAKEVERYFKLLGNEIVVHLEKAGYTRCLGFMMASESQWRGTMVEWQERLRQWALQSTPEQILLGYNFLSFRFLYGESSVNDQFVEMVNSQLQKSATFIYYMAQQEKEKPIPQLQQNFLTIFRGRSKADVIDIKKHALFPLHHCLQILGVNSGIINATPLEIISALQKKKKITKDFADEIRHAYEVSLSIRISMSWEKHLRNESISTEIDLRKLRRWELNELRTTLDTVRALQSHLLSKL